MKTAEAGAAVVKTTEAGAALVNTGDICTTEIAAWRTMRRAPRAVGWRVLSVLSGLVGLTLSGGSPIFAPSLCRSLYVVATVRGLKAV